NFVFAFSLGRLSSKIIGWVIVALAVPLTISSAGAALPSYQEVRAAYRPSDSMLLDRNGQVLHELRTDPSVRRLAWTNLEEVSPALQAAVVRAEDKRFREHSGVDWRALAGAAVQGLLSGQWRGASTISMQLAGMLDREPPPPGGRRSLLRKWRQVAAARALEAAWSKDQILEVYLNLAFFRGEHQGVAAAARRLFGKEPHGLDAAESAVLAALIRSPNAPPARIEARAVRVARSLDGPVADDDVRAGISRALQSPGGAPPPRAELAAHAARRILKGRRDAAAVHCTLDAGLQRFAGERLAHHLMPLKDRHVLEGAVLVADNATGEVRAYATATADPARSRFVDGVTAKRQAGSTLKPFLYALALDRRILTAASRLDDSPLDLAVTTGIYQPENYDRGFQGAVTVRTALAASLNVPAVRALEMAGVDAFLDVLIGLGIRELSAYGDFYDPSLALGTADVSLWELVNAYRTLANQGIHDEMALAPGPGAATPPRRVFSPQAAFIISDILADREARAPTFGLENPLATRFWTAVKTGTSKDMRDNWCVGYSQRFTVGVWIGNFSGDSMRDVSGVSGAAPIWLDLMSHLHRSQPSAAGPPPEGVILGEEITGGVPRREWFVQGTEAAGSDPSPAPAPARIAYPPAGSVFAIDPDIPPERQQIGFVASGAVGFPTWVLDGEALGAGAQAFWNPIPGRHALALHDAAGRLLDAVVFQVRGQPRPDS
ncbi:MAG TPA: penicillin-binding protein 1C, partial [Desulfobacterales bacterium]|nr:penicillin-binding protein 1C [Desulfobacterales bacterium]